LRILLTFLFCVLFEIPLCQGNNEVENSKSENDSISIVVINGLVRTKEKTIFREINFESGKKLFSSNSLIESWELRISSLSLFNEVICKQVHDTLFISVVEEFYYWFYPQGGFADRNFYNWAKTKNFNRLYFGGDFAFFNLFGLNHTLTLTLVSGYNQIYGVSYEIPSSKYSNGWGGKFKASYGQSHEIWLSTENDRIKLFDLESDYVQRISNFDIITLRKINYQNSLELGYFLSYHEINKTASFLNPTFFVFGNKQLSQTAYLNFTHDTRDQRHYPTRGNEMKFNFSLANQGYEKFNWVESVSFRWRNFLNIDKYHHIATLLYLQYKFGNLTYLNARQLGYNSDYIRGYESYVIDGRGAIMAKIAFRKALFLGKVDLQKLGVTDNYNKMPFSLWLSVFSDIGKIIDPNAISLAEKNNLNYQLLRSFGMSLIPEACGIIGGEISSIGLGHCSYLVMVI
jgi:outer membrane protein assembly factor BamA